MTELNLSLHRKARIWTNEFSEVCISPTSSLKRTFMRTVDASSNLRSNHFVVEIIIPAGARIVYGLLGAEYKNSQNNDLLLEIYSSKSKNRSYNDSLSNSLERNFVGLPFTYAESVEKAVTQYFENKINFVPSGKLTFKYAVHGEISSCQDIFEKLSTIICNYFFSSTYIATKRDYTNMISTIIG